MSTLEQQDRFDVAFYGDVREGYDEHHAKRSLKVLFDLPDYTIEAMFLACRTVIKSNIDVVTAKKYRQKLYTYGINAAIELTAPSKARNRLQSLGGLSSRVDSLINNGATTDGQVIEFPFVVTSEAIKPTALQSAAEPTIDREANSRAIASLSEPIDDTVDAGAKNIFLLESQLSFTEPNTKADSQSLATDTKSQELPSEHRVGSHQQPGLLAGFDSLVDIEPEDANDYDADSQSLVTDTKNQELPSEHRVGSHQQSGLLAGFDRLVDIEPEGANDYDTDSQNLVTDTKSQELPSEYRFGSHQQPDLLAGLDEFADIEPENAGDYDADSQSLVTDTNNQELPPEYRFGNHQQSDLLVGLDEFADIELENIGDYDTDDYTVPARQVGAPQYVLFNFTGQLSEYIKLWWLNTLTTLLSCGLHRPYADASRKRYFYQHLSTPKGERFEYLGPSATLINGYWPLTACVLGFLCFLAVASLKIAVLATGVLLIPVLPYCFITIRHNHLAVTRFRNVPFRFVTDYLSALKYFIGWPLLAALSLGFLLPRALQSIHRFIVENTDYAGIPFTYRANPKHYLVASVGIGAIGVCGLLVLKKVGIGYLSLFALSALAFVLWVWSMTKLINIYYNNSEWQGFRFYANYSLASYTWLVMVNVVGVVLTAGILMPWAMLRSAKYKALHISLIE